MAGDSLFPSDLPGVAVLPRRQPPEPERIAWSIIGAIPDIGFCRKRIFLHSFLLLTIVVHGNVDAGRKRTIQALGGAMVPSRRGIQLFTADAHDFPPGEGS